MAPLHPWEWPTKPWSRLHVDFAGPFQGKTFIVLVDSLSKWPEVATIPSTSSKNAIQFLRRTFATHGLPEMLVPDNGSAFTSKEFQTFTSRNGIRHVKCSAYHPSTNGLAERTMQTLKEALKKTTGDMETRLACFLFQYRITPHTSTGCSPAELLLGRKPCTHLDLIRPENSGSTPQSAKAPPKAVQTRVAQSQHHQKEGHDRRAKQRNFTVGQSVYVRNFCGHPLWFPGSVIGIPAPLTYVVDVGGGKSLRRHVDHVRTRYSEQQVPAKRTGSKVVASAGKEGGASKSGETSRMSERSQGTPPVVTQAEEGSVEISLANTHSGEMGIPTTPGDEAVHTEERGDAHNVEDTPPDSEKGRAGSTEPSHSGTYAPIAITPTHIAPTRHSTRIRQASDYYGWKHCPRMGGV